MTSLSTNTQVKRSGLVREVVIVVFASMVFIGLFTYLPLLLPFLAEYASALIAAAFIYLPALALWRKRESFSDIGVKPGRVLPALKVFLVVVIVVFPIFAAGFFAYHNALFQRNACPRADRLMAWPDSLYYPNFERLNRGLVVTKNQNEELLVINNTGRRSAVTARWHPDEIRADVGEVTDGDNLVRIGRLGEEGKTVRGMDHGHIMIFSNSEGPASVEISSADRADSVRVGNRDEEPLPFHSKKGFEWLLTLFLVQLLLIALPEEVFYRGYLQSRLQVLFKKRWVIFGGDVGPAVLVTSLIFAVGHLVAIPSASRLAVLFPSILFCWLRDRTDSVLMPIFLHALSNLLLVVLTRFLC